MPYLQNKIRKDSGWLNAQECKTIKKIRRFTLKSPNMTVDPDDLKKFIINEQEILNSFQNIHQDISQTFKECYTLCLCSQKIEYHQLYGVKIESVLDFLNDELNKGHWMDVPTSIRQAYTAASFIKAVMMLSDPNTSEDILPECVKCLDLGILLGAPLSINSELLTQSASFVTRNCPGKIFPEDLIEKRDSTETNVGFDRLNGEIIPILKCPSLESFNKLHFSTRTPVKLLECTRDWPACAKWEDVRYLLDVAGYRTVPIEIGSQYVDENWTQKLMSLKDFILNHYLENNGSIGYLAQHNLFNQIPELRKDIRIPDYCGLSRDYETDSNDPDINAWLGPKGTVSPLHYDPKDNLLTQIYGKKQILLYSPSDSEYLYPHNDRLLFNTAQVNPIHPDMEKHPEFIKAKMYKCILEPGEMLYIPEKWWHHVTSLSKSFSVSFWWQ